MKTILLFSRDPGGANTVIPLVGALGARGYRVRLFGKDVALDKYRQAGIEGIDIGPLLPGITPEAVRVFLGKEAPDAIITGTSADDCCEKYLWLASEELGIPSMAILDQWVNYGIRFSEYGVAGISNYLEDRQHPYLPARIIAMDDFARQEMIAEGLPAERVKVCGQPYFETLRASAGRDADGLELLSAKFGLSTRDFVVVFASEPIGLTYGENAYYWGYTERTIFASLVKALEQAAVETGSSLALIIRPHPKEDPAGLADLAADYCRQVRWHVDTQSDPWMLINRADLVCGMSSMFLLESFIMGRETLSIQIGLCRDNPFVLDRRGILPSIVSEAELGERLSRALRGGEQPTSDFEILSNPVQLIIAEMETLLCHN